MDHKNYQPSIDSSSFSATTNRDHYLKQLNKLSHNISKPNHTFNKHALPESQPHVYNISKNDFRDMVQKLTGSPGHDQQPKPVHPVSSSRLHRLRPPPLPQVVSHRPPPHSGNVAVAPPSPLPPFPSVHAESPVSAYMRFLRNSMPSSSYSSESEFQMPTSPFGCFNSLGCSQVPLSPTVPVSSPGWRDL
ncbi:VQ motif-containing protein 9 [Spatholobus suberectus]|nr:VQ motif-containing protein 9 [Spatholobus suberectus]